MTLTRLGIALATAVSGISHAYLYIHGYQHIPTVGGAFVVQAGASFALALLILLGWRAGHWAPSCCRARSGCSASPKPAGSRLRTLRSA
jgi:threonine/homoserine efflux transporter RhtA